MKRICILMCVVIFWVGCRSSNNDNNNNPANDPVTTRISDPTPTPLPAPTVTPTPKPAQPVRLNHIQSLGTHNSYREQTPLFEALSGARPELARTLEYEHKPLDVQFSTLGIRHIELDVFYDPNGGLYSNRAGYVFIRQDTASGIAELDEPGFKVFHLQDIDFQSSCLTFVACLNTVKTWSDANPGHLPIMILVEAKDEEIEVEPDPGIVVPLPIDATALDAIDAEILSVFEEDRIIKPADVKGNYSTLEEAVLDDAWPTIDASKGKVMFALDNVGAVRDLYMNGYPSLVGRIMFASADPGTPEAAFLKINDPTGTNEQLIRNYVSQGYMVRTRADSYTEEARANDVSKRDAALASGAHFISTDYPEANLDFSDYKVEIPGSTLSRCNPVSATDDCDTSKLEEQ